MGHLIEEVCSAPFQSAAGKPASTIMSPSSIIRPDRGAEGTDRRNEPRGMSELSRGIKNEA
jgi:hypothetical protein